MENFKPAFILQKDVAVLLSNTGKPIHNYAINKLVEGGHLPEPISKGKAKRWSVEELCSKLKITEKALFDTIKKSY